MDYYKLLGVNKSSSSDEIKKSYRKMSLKHHPDRKGGDAEMFKKINQAYEVLGDPQKKRNYDMTGSNPFMRSGMSSGATNGMDNIFSSIFGNNNMNGMGGININHGMPNVRVYRNGQSVFRGPQRPPIINKKITITIKDAYNGITFPLEIERWIMIDNIKSYEKEKIYIEVPKGIDSGEIIKMTGKGNILSENNKGDLKIFVTVNNNTKFQRQGLNLIYKKSLTLKEALCGFKFEFKHLNDKTYAMNNEEGNIIKPNYRKEISNLGMVRNNQKGRLCILFNIEFPEKLSKEQVHKLKDIL